MPKNGFKFGYVIDVISFLSTDLEVKKDKEKKQSEKRKKVLYTWKHGLTKTLFIPLWRFEICVSLCSKVSVLGDS